MDDLFDEFIEYDFIMGADVVECPYCGAAVSRSLLFDDKIECPECGKRFKVDK
jgi:DNA-directed RNA polymerase subunit RPC12/RpoP